MTVEERTVGRTTFERREIDAATIESQPALVAGLLASADPDLVLDVRLIGVRPDDLDVEPAEVEDALRRRLPAGPRAGPQPAGAHRGRAAARRDHLRRVHPQRRGPHRGPGGLGGRRRRQREAGELRDVLRLGRLLLAGQEVTL